MSRPMVLVVERDAVEGRRLERSLGESAPHSSVVLVESAAAAEQYLFSKPRTAMEDFPDLVVLDTEAADGDGVLLLKRIRSDGRTRTVPVVMVTPPLEDDAVRELYRSGANSYLERPNDGPEFARVMSATARYWLGLNVTATRRR